jgi:hypothetical protein
MSRKSIMKIVVSDIDNNNTNTNTKEQEDAESDWSQKSNNNNNNNSNSDSDSNLDSDDDVDLSSGSRINAIKQNYCTHESSDDEEDMAVDTTPTTTTINNTESDNHNKSAERCMPTIGFSSLPLPNFINNMINCKSFWSQQIQQNEIELMKKTADFATESFAIRNYIVSLSSTNMNIPVRIYVFDRKTGQHECKKINAHVLNFDKLVHQNIYHTAKLCFDYSFSDRQLVRSKKVCFESLINLNYNQNRSNNLNNDNNNNNTKENIKIIKYYDRMEEKDNDSENEEFTNNDTDESFDWNCCMNCLSLPAKDYFEKPTNAPSNSNSRKCICFNQVKNNKHPCQEYTTTNLPSLIDPTSCYNKSSFYHEIQNKKLQVKMKFQEDVIVGDKKMYKTRFDKKKSLYYIKIKKVDFMEEKLDHPGIYRAYHTRSTCKLLLFEINFHSILVAQIANEYFKANQILLPDVCKIITEYNTLC